MIENSVCRWHWNRRNKNWAMQLDMRRFLFITTMWEVDCSFDTNATTDAENVSLLWHYYNETIFLVLVCANGLHINNYNLYCGELLQYAILRFLQNPQIFSSIDMNVLILLEILQQIKKPLVILKDDSNLHKFCSLVQCVTWTHFLYLEILFLKSTKTKKSRTLS